MILRQVLTTFSESELVALMDTTLYAILQKYEYLYLNSDKKKLLVDFLCEFNVDNFFYDNRRRVVIYNALYRDEEPKMRQFYPYLPNSKFEAMKYISELPSNKKNLEVFHSLFEIPQVYEYNHEEVARIEYSREGFFELLDYQFLIKEQIVKTLETNPVLFRALIHMPTGTGKTKTTCHIVVNDFRYRMKKKGIILWLAHTHELLMQAYYSFCKVWRSIGKEEINIVFNDIDGIHENNTIIFMSYQKLISLGKRDSTKFDFLSRNIIGIVADEAHKCLASETRKTIERLMIFDELHSNKYLLGLSATPGRKFSDNSLDPDNRELSFMFEQRIFTISPRKLDYAFLNELDFSNREDFDGKIIEYFQERNILARIKRQVLKYEYQNVDIIDLSRKKDNRDFSQEIITHFGTIIDRNRIIIDTVLSLCNHDKQILLFSCGIEHGKLLEMILKMNHIKCASVYGSTNKDDRSKIIEDFNLKKINVLINFEVLTTGFDSPQIDVVFITRPTNSIVLYSQMIGRGLRGPKMGGKEEVLLIDLQDNFDRYSDENFAFAFFNHFWRG